MDPKLLEELKQRLQALEELLEKVLPEESSKEEEEESSYPSKEAIEGKPEYPKELDSVKEENFKKGHELPGPMAGMKKTLEEAFKPPKELSNLPEDVRKKGRHGFMLLVIKGNKKEE